VVPLTVNVNTAVPWSLIVTGPPFIPLLVVPIITGLIVFALLRTPNGPCPEIVAVTTVPIGPEVGERVTVGVLKVQVAVPVLP